LRTSYAGFEPPLIPGLSADAAVPGDEGNITDLPLGSFSATPDQNGPIAPLGTNTTPPAPNLNADIRAGTLAPRGSQLKLDDKPKDPPESGGAPQ
jgi:hypothetical protein